MNSVENLIVEFPNGKVELSVLELGLGFLGMVGVLGGVYILSKRFNKIIVNKNTGLEIDFAE